MQGQGLDATSTSDGSGVIMAPPWLRDSGDAVEDDVTELLRRWRSGERNALVALMPKVYRELHRLAVGAMRGERPDHTLQATALVNEAYLRFLGSQPPNWRDRTHFFAVTARMMRRILVDHARALTADRRGGGAPKEPLDAALGTPCAPEEELLALDEALRVLADLRPRQAQVLELRFFAGLSLEETAEALGVSRPTVVLDTRLGRAWLVARLRQRSAAQGKTES